MPHHVTVSTRVHHEDMDTALPLPEPTTYEWRLSENTCNLGRAGIAQARKQLAARRQLHIIQGEAQPDSQQMSVPAEHAAA